MSEFKKEDKYTEEVYTSSSGAIITIRRPILTDEERARRMDNIRKVGEKIFSNILSDPERREKYLAWKAEQQKNEQEAKIQVC